MVTEVLAPLTAFAFVSSITPGPNNLMLMSSGTRFGFARTLPHMLGVTVGFSIMIVLVGAGLARVFTAQPHAQTVLRWVSVGYLLYLAFRIATAKPPEAEGAKGDRPMTFLAAALFQWVNPKAWTMALTAVSVYATPARPWASLALVAGVFGTVNLPSVGSWALLGAGMRRLLSEPRRLRAFNVAAALLLVASLYPVVLGAR